LSQDTELLIKASSLRWILGLCSGARRTRVPRRPSWSQRRRIEARAEVYFQ